MTTTLPRRRRPRDVNTKRADLQQSPGGKGSTLPEYLEAHEVSALIAAAPNPQARLLTLEQWRAGLRVSEAWRWSPPTCARPPTGGPCGSGKTMGKNPVKCPCVLSCRPPLPLLPATARPVAAPWSTFHGQRPGGGSSWRLSGRLTRASWTAAGTSALTRCGTATPVTCC